MNEKIPLRAALDCLDEGICLIDEKGRLLFLNVAALNCLGYTEEESLGRKVEEVFAAPRFVHVLERAMSSGAPILDEIVTFNRKGGEFLSTHYSLIPVRSGQRTNGAVLRFREDETPQVCDVALRDSETKLGTILDTISDGVIAADEKGVIQLFNPAAEALFGYSKEEMMGRNVSQLMPSPDRESHDGYLENYLRTGVKKIIDIGREVTGKRKDGGLFPLYLSIGDAHLGKKRLFVAVLHDLTASKRDKDALQASEERFRQVAEMSGEWLWEQDPEGCYIYSSGAVSQILGYEPEEILGKSYLNLLTDEDKEHWTTALPPTHEVHARFYRLINRYRHKDGHEVFTESTGEPFFDANGRLIKWRGVDHDVTARKLYEDALRLRDRAIEAASVGINITDATAENNPNIYVNPALTKMTGYSRDELMGQSMSILQGPDTDRSAVEEIRNAVKEGRSCEVILKNYRKGGVPFWNDLLISPVRDNDVKLTHFIGVQSDITEKRRAEEERHELEIAKQIQLSLLPKAPLERNGLRVAGICLPATHVGGDYYDYFFSDDELNIVIADVSGHSMGAALIMAGVRSALKAETRKSDAGHSGIHSALVLKGLNELLYEDLNSSDLFISMFYLRCDPATRNICYANAGHNRPLLLSESESACRELDADGMIFGIKKEMEFQEQCVQLSEGDKVLLYTDGITEAQSPSGEFFGVSRLCDLFSAQRRESPEIAIKNLLDELQDFCGGRPFNDDVTLVVLNVG